MTLMQRLTEDMKSAMRAKDQLTLDAIRFIIAKIKNFEIDKPNHEAATEGEIEAIVRKIVKDCQEALEQYKAGGREDLVEEESKKIAVSQRYLPTPLSDDEVWTLIRNIRAENPDIAQGPLTGKVLALAKGKTDGGVVARLLRERQQ